MHVLLIGNYLPDRQQSMQRFGQCLLAGLADRAVSCEIIRPEARLSQRSSGLGGFAKWFGYLDKFVIFPRLLATRLAALGSPGPLVHILDHSNSPYVRRIARFPHVITCHDTMAILSAQGHFPQNRTRLSGRILQSAILSGLRRARHLICISKNTQRDLEKLLVGRNASTRSILYQLNHPYERLDASEAHARCALAGFDPGDPFVLHVGNNSWYKNRDGLLRVFKRVQSQTPKVGLKLVIIGDPMTSEQGARLKREFSEGEVVWLPPMESARLQAYYSLASVFLFPSIYEGFGWPPIEAQACGCPVVTTPHGGLAEAVQSSALTASHEDEALLARHITNLVANGLEAATLVEKGYVNVKRFAPPRMVVDYLEAYRQVLKEFSCAK